MSDMWVSTLDVASIKKATDELNEIPEDREAAVQALREWMEQQPHFICKTDTPFLLSILRGTKFSQLRARQLVEGQLKMFNDHPQWFSNIDPKEKAIQTLIEKGYTIPLPKRDKNGCRIMLFRIAALNPDLPDYDHADPIRMAMVMNFLMANDAMSQVNGLAYVFDFTGVSLKHMTAAMRQEDMKKFHKVWQKNMPGRFKAFHYYNAGAIFETMMALVKPFWDKKFQERIKVHDTLESLYKYVDKELLPEEYLPDDYNGPCVGTVQKLIADFKHSLDDNDFRQRMLDRANGKYRIDESKRPQHQEPVSLFRKLNVD